MYVAKQILRFLSIGFSTGFLLFGCASKTITFTSTQDVLVTMQKIGNFEEQGEAIKLATPIPEEKLVGKMVRFSSLGKQSQYLVFVKPEGDATSIHVDLSDKEFAPNTGPNTLSHNGFARLILQGSMALESKNFKGVSEIADKLEKLDATLAAPHILKGLAHMEQGQTKDALAQFKQAKTLDPENIELDQLIQSVQ